MADTNEEKTRVNLEMPTELAEKLDILVAESEFETDRSKFMRDMIRERWARRQQMALPLDGAPARKSGNVRRVAVAA